jgi:chaperonin cofactor prefoldin
LSRGQGGGDTDLEQRVAKLEEKQRVLRQENRSLRHRVEQLEAALGERAAEGVGRLSAQEAAARVQAVVRGRHDRRTLEAERAAAEDIVSVALLAQEAMGAVEGQQAVLDAARSNPKVAGALGLVPPAVIAAFERFDTNKDQVIDYRELRAALMEYGIDASADFAAALLSEYDDFPDGTLDIFEFTRLIKDLEVMRSQQQKHEAEMRQMRAALQEQLARAASAPPAMPGASVPPAVPLAVPPSAHIAPPAQGQQAYVLVTDPTTGGQLLLPLPQAPKQ